MFFSGCEICSHFTRETWIHCRTITNFNIKNRQETIRLLTRFMYWSVSFLMLRKRHVYKLAWYNLGVNCFPLVALNDSLSMFFCLNGYKMAICLFVNSIFAPHNLWMNKSQRYKISSKLNFEPQWILCQKLILLKMCLQMISELKWDLKSWPNQANHFTLPTEVKTNLLIWLVYYFIEGRS